MACDGNGIGVYIFEGYQPIDATVDGPRPSGADAKFCIGEEALEPGVAIFILVVGGGLGASNTCGNVAALQDVLDDIVIEIAPTAIAIEEHGRRSIPRWYPERKC